MKLRLLTAVAVLVSGAVHLWLWYDVFRGETVVGPMFLLNVAASVVIAGLLLRWRHWLPAFLAVGFGASTLGAFVIATTDNGLFGVHESVDGWLGVPGRRRRAAGDHRGSGGAGARARGQLSR